MMQPSQLLENLGVVRRMIEDSLVGSLGTLELFSVLGLIFKGELGRMSAYVFLLLMNMSDLEPNVLLSERSGWRVHNVLEAL